MKFKRKGLLALIISMIIVVSIGCSNANSKSINSENNSEASTADNIELPSLTYIGHATVKIKTKEGKVIYIDPAYSADDYSEKADYILVTHEHDDHNKVNLVKKE